MMKGKTKLELNEQSPKSTETLTSRAFKGAGWTLGGFGFSRLLRLLNHLILAWLVAPEVFGLMALVRIFQQGLQMFSDVGIKPCIIRSTRGDDSQFLKTAWTIQVLRGCALWIVSCLLAVPYAWLYSQNDPEAWQLAYLIPLAAFQGVLGGFQSTALATLTRRLQLGKITVMQIKVQLVTLVAIVIWATVQPNAWAMVGGGLIGGVFSLVLGHRLVLGQPVGFAWDRDCAKEIFGFGKWIFLSTMFTFLSLNTDTLSLGNVLSLSDLGTYVIALVFAKAALDVSMRLGSTVMFPVYSHYRDDPKHLMKVALKARRAVLWVGGVACVCFAVCAPLLIETLWDERYHAAGQIGQWLAIYIWARIVLNSMDRIPLALGNSRAIFLSTVVQFCGILPAAIGYYLGGLPAFVVGLSLGPLAAHMLLIRALPERREEMFLQTFQFTVVGLIFGISAVLFTVWLRDVTGPVFAVTTQLAICVFSVATSIWATWDLLPFHRISKSFRLTISKQSTTQ